MGAYLRRISDLPSRLSSHSRFGTRPNHFAKRDWSDKVSVCLSLKIKTTRTPSFAFFYSFVLRLSSIFRALRKRRRCFRLLCVLDRWISFVIHHLALPYPSKMIEGKKWRVINSIFSGDYRRFRRTPDEVVICVGMQVKLIESAYNNRGKI